VTSVLDLLKIVYIAVRVIIAVVGFAVTKRTPFYPYLGMRRLHVLSRGVSTRILASILSAERRSEPTETTGGILGTLEPVEAKRLAQRIRQDGFVVFESPLDPQLCDELERFARTTEARLTPPLPGGETIVYDPTDPRATRYDFSEQQLLRFPPVQRIAVDPSVRAVAQAYLQATPVNDMVAMWWTVAHGGVSSEAAQMFHYDLDRPRFLKFFIYLTDVTSDTGPHVFVRGTHHGRPDPFYEDRRFTDEEVADVFPDEAVTELAGPRGTIMAVDTSGLHKGKHPGTGDRLVFQMEFSVSLFGVDYETLPRNELVPEAAAEVDKSPKSFERFAS